MLFQVQRLGSRRGGGMGWNDGGVRGECYGRVEGGGSQEQG